MTLVPSSKVTVALSPWSTMPDAFLPRLEHALGEHADEGVDEVTAVDEVGVGLDGVVVHARPRLADDRDGRQPTGSRSSRSAELTAAMASKMPHWRNWSIDDGRRPMPAPTSPIWAACS